jgi:polar amino acid transport system substrate-binding protein/glutamate/aspartate transport system substrate-binding protein
MNAACWKRLAVLLIVMASALAGAASAATLDRIRQDKVLRIAYRADAPPFSYKNTIGEPAGYMVDLCRAVAKQLAQQLNLPSLSVAYVQVTAADRFDAITQGKADLLCEATSATLGRRALVDFSVETFVDGASFVVGPDGPHSLPELASRTIGVLAGTTTEQELHDYLSGAGITATVLPAKTHAEGLSMLDEGKISAYFADRSILVFLLRNSKAPEKLSLADVYLTFEPYALALPRGDEDFRLEVDRALSHIYRSGEVGSIFTYTFGDKAKSGPILRTLYLISALPD